MSPLLRVRRLRWPALLLAISLVAATCGDDREDSEAVMAAPPPAAELAVTTEAASPAAPAAAEPAPAVEPEPAPPAPEPAPSAEEPAVLLDEVWIAYLSGSSANTWYASSRREMQKIADEHGIEMVEFDAAFDPQAQTAQLQDVIASGDYHGVIVAAVNGPGLIPDIEDALAEGIEVVVLNTVVGDDLAEGAPQVDGIAASSLAPPVENGERMGELTVQACGDLDPCEVVYLYGIKGFPLDVALKEGFDAVLARNPSVSIVAEGEGQYLGPEGGINAMQDIMIAAPTFDVVIGADQSIQGVEIVLADEGITDVKLIGLGGSITGLQAVAEGRWFGVIYGAPGTEGANAMGAMILALTEGIHSGGINPLANVTDNGLVTAANVDRFEGQWDG